MTFSDFFFSQEYKSVLKNSGTTRDAIIKRLKSSRKKPLKDQKLLERSVSKLSLTNGVNMREILGEKGTVTSWIRSNFLEMFFSPFTYMWNEQIIQKIWEMERCWTKMRNANYLNQYIDYFFPLRKIQYKYVYIIRIH